MFKKNVSFEVTLKPVKLDKRTIQFELVVIGPVDINFISSKIFNRQLFINYTKRTITLDFDTWDIVRKVPIGNIKSYEMFEGEMNIK